jgi:hypothetical protein
MALPPVPLKTPIMDRQGQITQPWAAYFREISRQAGETLSTADLEDHLNDTAGAHAASAIANSPSGNLAATDVQGALNELQGDVNTLNSDVSAAQDDATQALSDAAAAQSDIDDHLADTSGAHAASAISYNNGTSELAATEAQAAIDELAADVADHEDRIGTLEAAGGVTEWWFKATSNNGQNGLGASAYERIEFEDEVADPQGLYNPATGTLTMTADSSLRPWVLKAKILTTAEDIETAGDRAFLALYRNGALYEYFDFQEVDDPNSAKQWMLAGEVFIPVADLGVGVTFDVRGFVDDAATSLSTSGDGCAFWGYML